MSNMKQRRVALTLERKVKQLIKQADMGAKPKGKLTEAFVTSAFMLSKILKDRQKIPDGFKAWSHISAMVEECQGHQSSSKQFHTNRKDR